jgi:hypothetical protein
VAAPEKWVWAYARWRAQHDEPEEGFTDADLELAFKAGWDAKDQET